VVVPVFLKNTWNGCEGPGAIFRNADSPAYSESYPTTALACPVDGPNVRTNAMIVVTTKRIALSSRKLCAGSSRANAAQVCSPRPGEDARFRARTPDFAQRCERGGGGTHGGTNGRGGRHH